jgi:hypothetical protein
MNDKIEDFRKYLLDEAKEAKRLSKVYGDSDDGDCMLARHDTFMEVYGAFLVAFPREKTK